MRTELQAYEPAYYAASDPFSPYANADGLVATPNVDLANELVQIKMAEVAYKANASIIKTSKEMDDYLLDALV